MYFVSENKFRHTSESVNIKNIINAVVKLIQTDLNNRNIKLNVNIDTGVPETIAVDVNKLK